MYDLPTSCLVVFFLFTLCCHLSCASIKKDLESCEDQFQCGNITADFPFWGATRLKDCGHPLLELRCLNNITFLTISDQEYHVLHINKNSKTLRLASAKLVGSFCNASSTATITLPPKIFELSPTYKNLTVFYHCDDKLPYRASYTCPGRGSFSISQNLDYHKSCNDSFTINVPKSFVPEEKELNLTHMESALREGFEVKLKIDEKPCQDCLFYDGICGFADTKQTCSLKTSPSKDSKGEESRRYNKGLKIAEYVLLSPFLVMLLLYILNLAHDLGQKNLKEFEPQPTLNTLIPQPKLKALIPLKQYSYEQVKRITKSFAEEVGRGGFGTVYRGTLCDGRIVAVKVLKELKGNNGEDFINEVSSMSQTSHVNIVTLLGFCSEGSKRAILYELMENGSLDKFISSKSSSNMNWRELYGIALGVARGLEYLHHGCRTRIVHFDIKPQNVLLDDNLCPKVSDFGLAKLCENNQSILSLLDTRGTIGYIAPELFSKMYGRVSHKSDVYSYGMLVLEMIGARNKTSTGDTSSNASSMYFPEWIYKDLEKGDNERLNENEIRSQEEEIKRKMTLVGLWCIQPSPLDRPPMNRVVEMMEGRLDALGVPPKPVLQQISTGTLQESSTLSEDISVYTEVCSTNVV